MCLSKHQRHLAHKQTHGFMLIEFLVYFILLAFISVLLMRFVVLSLESLKTFSFYKHSIQMEHAMTLLINDLYRAPSMQYWKHNQPYSFVIAVSEQDIGWLLENKCLYRLHGNYDSGNNAWTKKAKNLVCQSISAFSCELIEPNTFKVTLTSSLRDYTIVRYVARRIKAVDGK